MMNNIGNIFRKIKQWLLTNNNPKCKHIHKTEIYQDYPDAYIEYVCDDCGKEIFEDMYSN